MIPHEPENVFYRGRGNFRRGGAGPPGADLYGLANRDRRLVGTDVGELDRSRRRWWPRLSRFETHALGLPQLAACPMCMLLRSHNRFGRGRGIGTGARSTAICAAPWLKDDANNASTESFDRALRTAGDLWMDPVTSS
jgi:hypothetical protein